MSTPEDTTARRDAFTERFEADSTFLRAIGAALEAEVVRRRNADPREPALTAEEAASIVAAITTQGA
ncbi:hypothetical protein [Variovorax sp. N23]|uniref:hypothetical protein n=1 Tax=Variovorax sp. N23 TaxID=2980555 RepID=UPI0021C7D635|nr:hypothetical protein [Variovorax sp. N23]MCU4119316.1 hypothetical protein [Variovorax sp. N23]